MPRTLRRLAAERHARDGLQVFIEISGDRVLPAPVASGLYAIAQESLNNVVKHAGTGQASIRLNLAGSGAYLEIQDDGPGFEPETALAKPGHLGLVGMTDRAREIGWNLIIDSGCGRGTRIRVEEKRLDGAR